MCVPRCVWEEGGGKDVIGDGSSRPLCQALVSFGGPADSEEGLWYDRADDLSGDPRWPKMPGIQGKCYMRGLMIKPFDDSFYS
jgi:hypothetical protein